MDTEDLHQPGEEEQHQGSDPQVDGDPAPATAEGQEGEAAAPDQDGGEPTAKPKKKRFQERLNEVTRARREAERSAAELAEENARLKAQIGQPAQQDDGTQKEEPPKEDDFADYNEFLQAQARFEGRQAYRQERELELEQSKERDTREAQQRAQKEYLSRCEEASEAYEDFVEVAFNPDLPISAAMAEVITAETNGPDIAYWLGSNPAEAQRISQLSPTLAAHELGKIGAGLKRPEPNKTTNAPDPVEPVGAREQHEKPLSDLSYEEYKARRMGN